MSSRRPSDRQCAHVRPNGQRCQAARQSSSRYCFFHDPVKQAELHVARRVGGINRSRPGAVLPANTPFQSLKNPGDVKRLLSDTINQTLRGIPDPKAASAVGNLCGIYLRAREESDIASMKRAVAELMLQQG